MSARRTVGIKKLSEHLGIPVDTIYQWATSRQIPHSKRGGEMKFDLDEIEDWIKKRKTWLYNLQQYYK